MFIVMNCFRVAKGSEAALEQVWMSRDSHLEKAPGFVAFHLLKGPEAEDHTLYASHTIRKTARPLKRGKDQRACPFRPGTCRRIIGKWVFLPVNFGKFLKCARSSCRTGDAIAALNASGESNTTSLPTI